MLKVCFIVDTEGEFYYKIPSPHIMQSTMRKIKWQLNKIVGKVFRYPNPTRRGFENLLRVFKENNIPASFAVVGHLYLKSCKGWPHSCEQKPKAKWFDKDWYYWDPCSNYKEYSGFYFGDIIEKENNKLFDFGLHAFSHEAYLIEDKKMIESSIKSAIAAAKTLNIKPVFYEGPWNMIEEKENKELLSILKKNGIKIIAYSGINAGLKQKKEFRTDKLFQKSRLKAIWISNYIEGTSKKVKIEEIKKQILQNLKTNKIYCLAMHDFTWKNTKKLEKIINFVKKLEQEGKLEVKNARQLYLSA